METDGTKIILGKTVKYKILDNIIMAVCVSGTMTALRRHDVNTCLIKIKTINQNQSVNCIDDDNTLAG